MNKCYFLDGDFCLYSNSFCKFIQKENCPYFFKHGLYISQNCDDEEVFEIVANEIFQKDDDNQKQ